VLGQAYYESAQWQGFTRAAQALNFMLNELSISWR